MTRIRLLRPREPHSTILDPTHRILLHPENPRIGGSIPSLATYSINALIKNDTTVKCPLSYLSSSFTFGRYRAKSGHMDNDFGWYKAAVRPLR